MARTVEDLALFLSAIAGPDPRTPLSIHEPGSRFAQPLARDCKGLRIAWCDQFAGLPFDSRVSAVVNARRRTFEDLGCVTEDANPDFSGADEAFKTLRALGFYLQHGELLEQHRAQMKRTVVDEIERGARLTGPQIARAQNLRSQLFARIGEFMRGFDFLVLPVVQVPPFDIDQEYVTEIDRPAPGNLCGLDALLLLHQRHCAAGHFRPGGFHAGRLAGGPANCWAASR